MLDLESRSRRKNIRIYGVPEGSEKESTTMISFVENLLREGLELTNDMPDLQIERAHRSLGPQPPADAPPRSIVIKCLSFKTKDTLLRKAWQKKGFARKPHKPGPRLPTSNTQETKRIHRDTQSAEGK